jgi:hypothetical protein
MTGYPYQQKIGQSREISNTRYRKVNLKDNKTFQCIYIALKDTLKYINVRQHGFISSYVIRRIGLPYTEQSQ